MDFSTMARQSISRFMIIVAVVALTFHGSCATTEAIAESKSPATDPLTNTAIRVDLIQRDSPMSPLLASRNLSMAERLRRAVERSHSRLRRLQHYTFQNAKSYYSPLNYVDGEYFMQMAIGSPVPLNLHFILDTGSDLMWTQCEPCNISSSFCEPQNDPMFDPFQSSSYKIVSCSNHFCSYSFERCNLQLNCVYNYTYGSGQTSGLLSEETFSLRTVGSSKWTSFPNLAFGCGSSQAGNFGNSAGIIGLGRGPLSLVSQIGSSFGNIFSYCLGSIYNASETSPLFLGRSATVGAGFSATPLIQNHLQNNSYQTFYYLGLDGISVAGEPVPIPKGTFGIQANGSGGLLIDSGTTFTYLVDPAYQPFLEAVRSNISAQPVNAFATTGLDLCYNSTPAIHYPTIIFHFAGGADYVLPPEKSFISDQKDTGGLACLAFNSSEFGLSIFGNFQQQNFHIVYDLGHNKLSFTPTNCASL